MPDELRDAFLREVADSIRSVRQTLVQLSTEGRLTSYELDLALYGVAHSILVTLDGGTELSTGGRKVFLVDRSGDVVSEGLHEYLPEYLDEVLEPRSVDAALDVREEREIAGWIWEESARRWLDHVALYTGYSFDDSDWAAFESGLVDTDDDVHGSWFEYPLVGSLPVTVRMARCVGDATVAVTVIGDLDNSVASRIDTLTDLL